MKKILLAGLIVSILSILFNIFVFSYYSNKISMTEKELSFLSSRNLFLTIEAQNAERSYFFADYYLNEARRDLVVYGNLTTDIRNLLKKKDQSIAKALNYALNSTILDPTMYYDSIPRDVKRVQELIYIFQENSKLPEYLGYNKNEDNEIRTKYNQYYIEHEALIKENLDTRKKLLFQKASLDKRFGIAKGIAVSFQILGLILIFLKDTKR